MEIARPLHQTLLNCQLQTDLATGRISHGRVATMQSTFEQTGRVRHFQRHRHAVHTMHVECNTVGMEMDVQQPGHQKAAVEIDNFGTVATERSEERGEGQECDSTCRSRWSTDN